MSDTRECHCKTKVVVIHKKPKRRIRPFKAAWSLASLIPGFHIVKGVLLLLVIWYGLRIFTPNYDVPYVPFASCQSGTPEERPNGVVGAAYEAGDALRGMTSMRPSVDEIKGRLYEASHKAGELFASLSKGFNGAPAPQNAFYEAGKPPPGMMAASDCGQCDTSGGSTTIAASGTPAVVAARAALNAGFRGEEAVQAVKIAGAESTYNPEVQNSIGASGLWQIMLPMHNDLLHGDDWRDPFVNARMAYALYKQSGWAPWYSSRGNWDKFSVQAAAAVAEVQAGLGSSDLVPVSATTPSESDARITDSVGGHSKAPSIKAAAFVRSQFDFQGTILGYSYRNIAGTSTLSEHASGFAIDVMVGSDKALGDQIAQYFAGPGYKPFGANNVIWYDNIYNAARGWHSYGDHGSPTLNHMDHVHIDFYPAGGSGDAPVAGVGACTSTGGDSTVTAGSLTGSGMERIATYNVLGAGHTTGGPGSHRGFGPWESRIDNTVDMVKKTGVSLVGFQEMQTPQHDAFRRMMPGWDTWHPPGAHTDNTIAWRTDTWSMVKATSVRVPYFRGDVAMPMVLMQHKSGSRLWVLDVHNPADAHGPAAGKRAVAVQREIAVLEKAGGTAIWLGDMNSHEPFYCTAVRAGFVSAAPGGSLQPCRAPGGGTVSVDWIMGARDIDFSGWARVRDTEASDHAMSVASISWGNRSAT